MDDDDQDDEDARSAATGADDPVRQDDDYGTPASPPDDVDDAGFPLDHPALDTGVDEHELYDEGRANAAVDLADDEMTGSRRGSQEENLV